MPDVSNPESPSATLYSIQVGRPADAPQCGEPLPHLLRSVRDRASKPPAQRKAARRTAIEDDAPGSQRRTQLLTVPQVASRLSVSERKVYRMISEKQLQVLRVGKRGTRITDAAIEAYIARLATNVRN